MKKVDKSEYIVPVIPTAFKVRKSSFIQTESNAFSRSITMMVPDSTYMISWHSNYSLNRRTAALPCCLNYGPNTATNAH